ncbi:hypothetical protein THAOC_04910 [Thalassiosira oceanica]|uniref:Uncharacterized protein n=1 Tax=Thalassiosira oceanica TaxID=159749 RepID=K0T714_THAOC|nr:hypothetical protein THAOC_04910 [Thalassiosira oceanica]|eukprot:EJK73465.1 hypothetical protein THAOC_04910 [Thalassiosira oceanica]
MVYNVPLPWPFSQTSGSCVGSGERKIRSAGRDSSTDSTTSGGRTTAAIYHQASLKISPRAQSRTLGDLERVGHGCMSSTLPIIAVLCQLSRPSSLVLYITVFAR